jgi:alanine racemase
MVNLDTVPEAKIGDEVVLIGKQNGAAIKVEDLAQDWGTISYEVICGLADRIPRFFIDSSTSNGKTSK